VIVVGGMLAHNLLDFVRKSVLGFKVRTGAISHEPSGDAEYLRMTVNERIQHASLMLSFIILVVTGFMLRYPDAWWVAAIHRLSGNVFELRSLMHRVAAVLMTAASVYHVAYVAFTIRGRQLVRDLFPTLRDGTEAVGMVLYNLGLSRRKPEFGRFSYIEKAEYWALAWGTIVMVATGGIMWFENRSIGLLTKLGWDIARTIHFYEAWLATLAILVWHIYYVVFSPDVYPMSLAWLTGRLTEEEMASEHPRELMALKTKEEEAESERGAS
jgi:cytochrome b subunit of formate dehydrogenase